MRFATFEAGGERHPGIVSGDTLVSLRPAGFPTLISFLEGGLEASRRLEALLEKPPADAIFPLRTAKLLAPIPRPGKILAIGLNYRDHARESGMEIPKTPVVFAKFPTTVVGPGDPIVLPRSSSKPDYEAELAFLIGKAGRYIPRADWRNHVFGFMNLNDVSARDYQLAVSQWTMGKNFDTFCPMGPWVVTADEIADPGALRIRCIVSGETLQDSNTSELVFGVPELVEYLSSVVTLEAGDVVATGTPPGVGMGRKPERWLKPGDTVTIAIEGLGELTNPIVAGS